MTRTTWVTLCAAIACGGTPSGPAVAPTAVPVTPPAPPTAVPVTPPASLPVTARTVINEDSWCDYIAEGEHAQAACEAAVQEELSRALPAEMEVQVRLEQPCRRTAWVPRATSGGGVHLVVEREPMGAFIGTAPPGARIVSYTRFDDRAACERMREAIAAANARAARQAEAEARTWLTTELTATRDRATQACAAVEPLRRECDAIVGVIERGPCDSELLRAKRSCANETEAVAFIQQRIDQPTALPTMPEPTCEE